MAASGVASGVLGVRGELTSLLPIDGPRHSITLKLNHGILVW